MIDYTILYRTQMARSDPWSERWDLFISSFNSSERVKVVFDKAQATEKKWLIHEEYDFDASEAPANAIGPGNCDEARFMHAVFNNLGARRRASVCVDITGMLRPHIMVLLLMMFDMGVRKFDVLYSEPSQYLHQEQTKFSIAPVISVRPVLGFEGNHTTGTDRDLLVLGCGYEECFIGQVSEHKRGAKKLLLYSLPSLMPDMYQESYLSSRRAVEAGGEVPQSQQRFAPANNPFATASVLQAAVNDEAQRAQTSNLYLSPLATKPRALAFALYYLTELRGTPSSIILPFASGYPRSTSTGVGRIWKYTVEYLGDHWAVSS